MILGQFIHSNHKSTSPQSPFIQTWTHPQKIQSLQKGKAAADLAAVQSQTHLKALQSVRGTFLPLKGQVILHHPQHLLHSAAYIILIQLLYLVQMEKMFWGSWSLIRCPTPLSEELLIRGELLSCSYSRSMASSPQVTHTAYRQNKSRCYWHNIIH